MNTIKIILLTLCLTLTNMLTAQETIIPLEQRFGANNSLNNVYYKDVNLHLDKFLGTWLFDDGTTFLQITFIKKNVIENNTRNRHSDELVCEYLFKINNVIVYDTYGLNSEINEYLANRISGCNLKGYNYNQIDLLYSEPSTTNSCRGKGGELTLEFVDNLSQPNLIWSRESKHILSSSHPCSDGTPADVTDFLIPANLILTKQ